MIVGNRSLDKPWLMDGQKVRFFAQGCENHIMQHGDDVSASIRSVKNIFAKKRPLGVWVLTTYALILAGINLSGDSLLVLKGEVAMFRSVEVPSMLLWAYLNIGIIIASLLSWTGWKPGCVLFLCLICIYYLEQGMGIYLWIIHPQFVKMSMGEQIEDWFRLISSFLFPILYFWYFNKTSTKKFYRKVDGLVN